ncbi:VOC family protein [Streptomyces olivaceoviridis]|uniref:VOC family protein n=1 Tax=Streptomyces olivaceoviridis TaxID=1921 RepID=UPI0036B2F2D0
MTTSPRTAMPVVQIAFSALDIEATTAWYRDVLGFLPADGVNGGGAGSGATMGLPSLRTDLVKMVDNADLFQLEFFRFHDPVPQPTDRHPSDAGWALVGLYVDDLDAALSRLRAAGAPIGPVLGEGTDGRVVTRDPEGVWLELRERTPGFGPHEVRRAQVTTGFVRAVVSDLDKAKEFFSGGLGLRDTGTTLHDPADEALWSSLASATRSAVLSTDGNLDGLLIELVQYTERIPRPLPANYQLSDQGFVNVAFGSRSVADYETVTEQISNGGYRLLPEMSHGTARARYLLGADDLSVELITIPDRDLEKIHGFEPTSDREPTTRSRP